MSVREAPEAPPPPPGDDTPPPDAAEQADELPDDELPGNEPLNDDLRDGDEPEDAEDGGGSSLPKLALPSWATKFELPETRILIIVGASAAIGLWVVMILWLGISLGSLDRSVQELRREVAAAQATPEELLAHIVATPEIVMIEIPAPPPAEAQPEPDILLFGKPIVTDGADLWDCRDFRTWDQALTVYQANLPDDPNFIDFDANGVPCEALRAGG